MLKVIAEDFIHPEHIDTVMPWYRELVEKTRQEPLNISYELCIDQQDPGHFIFIESWPDRAALDVHCQTSISPGWCRRLISINASLAPSCLWRHFLKQVISRRKKSPQGAGLMASQHYLDLVVIKK